jgi:putative restriction endonuclease
MVNTPAVVANTDREWFDHFWSADGSRVLDEVNFWRPSAQSHFRALPPGGPFFLRLKHPINAIAGFGFFAVDAHMSPEMAWEIFAEKNGDPDRARFMQRIHRFRSYLRSGQERQTRADGPLSCLVLREVVFLPQSEWLPWERAEEWSPRVVDYKIYDLLTGPGRALATLLDRQGASPAPDLEPAFSPLSVRERPTVYRASSERVGQGTFRARLMMAYEGQCAVTGEHALPVLEAAHIQEYMSPASNHLQNGLLLRADLHRLFDRGYISVSPDLRLEVSPRLKTEFENGRIYYEMSGSRIHVPRNPNARPSPAALQWHRESVFR